MQSFPYDGVLHEFTYIEIWKGCARTCCNSVALGYYYHNLSDFQHAISFPLCPGYLVLCLRVHNWISIFLTWQNINLHFLYGCETIVFFCYLIWKYALNIAGLLLFSLWCSFWYNETEPMDLNLSCLWLALTQ
jgi:hypothetical protein